MREPTEREWLEGIGERFEREHEETRPHPVFVESVDVDRAWEVYYQLADRRHKDGLTLEELRQVIEGLLNGNTKRVWWCQLHHRYSDVSTTYCAIRHVKAHWRPENQCRMVPHLALPLVSPWVEVEEHQ